MNEYEPIRTEPGFKTALPDLQRNKVRFGDGTEAEFWDTRYIPETDEQYFLIRPDRRFLLQNNLDERRLDTMNRTMWVHYPKRYCYNIANSPIIGNIWEVICNSDASHPSEFMYQIDTSSIEQLGVARKLNSVLSANQASLISQQKEFAEFPDVVMDKTLEHFQKFGKVILGEKEGKE